MRGSNPRGVDRMVCERHAQPEHTGNHRASVMKGNPYLQGKSLTSDLFGTSTSGHPSAVQILVSPCPVTGKSKATHSKMEQLLLQTNPLCYYGRFFITARELVASRSMDKPPVTETESQTANESGRRPNHPIIRNRTSWLSV